MATYTNYVKNPRVFTDLAGVSGSGVTRVTNDGVTGATCIDFSSSTNYSAASYSNDAIPLPPPGTIWVTFAAKLVSGPSNYALYQHFRTSSWAVTGTNVSRGAFTPTSSWQRFTYSFDPAAPADAAYLKLDFMKTVATAAVLRVTDVMVTTANVAYFDGSTSGGTWSGTPHASTSTWSDSPASTIPLKVKIGGALVSVVGYKAKVGGSLVDVRITT
ncbi:MAG: hypothetical protein ACR2OE_11810 [Thermomicrobiales bacterium]